ncbi:MAG: hypothetical protein KF770_12265 [Anaerolineae bacterium]|nr:hypothetical protein [Anaerolineae bacterium]
MILGNKPIKYFVGLVILGLLVGCQNEPRLTEVDVQATVDAGIAGTMIAQGIVNTSVAQTMSAAAPDTLIEPTALPPTSTPLPAVILETPTPVDTATPPPTNTAVPTDTPSPLPTDTPTAVPTDTPIPLPTNTPAPPQPTRPPATATLPPDPVFGGQFLPNPSFEEGWYNMWGLPELQLPNNWAFEWDEGPTGFGSNPWDQWYRPETRVLPSSQLPENERGLFIKDGNYTIKIFKGNGPISFRMYQDVNLPAGTYKLTIRAYPDLVMAYNGNSKVFANDPYAGEIRIIGPGGGTAWLAPAFGVWNDIPFTFTLNDPASVRLGIGIRARYGLMNNGWFFDNWKLERVQ